ncbi:polysaccharide deacetylase family protein [bacterium]|nr:polysaccharide deacetylase family protein [bacterium]
MRSTALAKTTSILTVDYEDWFHVAHPSVCDPAVWDSLPSDIEDDTRHLLDVLEQHNAKATFFVVGWLAARTPDTLREIVRRGHQIGLHGYFHTPPNRMSEVEFQEDLLRCQREIVAITGVTARGYRAPFFGVRDCSFSYVEVLRRCGFSYDASVLASFLPGRGDPGTSPSPHPTDSRRPSFWEIPIPAVRIAGFQVAFSGGGFLRLLPARFVRWSSRRVKRSGTPVVYYVHPRDLNPAGRTAPTGIVRRVRYYGGRSTTQRKLEEILRASRAVSVEEFLSTAHGFSAHETIDEVRGSNLLPPSAPASSRPCRRVF